MVQNTTLRAACLPGTDRVYGIFQKRMGSPGFRAFSRWDAPRNSSIMLLFFEDDDEVDSFGAAVFGLFYWDE
jgi:hypothetical protein